MKKLISFLLILCLLLSCGSSAFAASKPSISTQPVSQTVKTGGSVTFKLKAKNFTALTWYFVNPENGEKISARHIGEKFKGLKVQNPNSQSLTLKKVPQEIHGWSLYCHLVGNGHKVDSDTVLILIKGMEPPENAAVPASGSEEEEVSGENAPEAENSSTEGEESSGPIKPFTVTAAGELQLYELSRSGKPTGDPKSVLNFEEEAAFFVKANGYIQYLLINDMQLTPSDNVTGLTIRGITKDTTIQGRVIKADGISEALPAAEDRNTETESAEEEVGTQVGSDETADESSGSGDSEVSDSEDEEPEYTFVATVSPTPAPEIPADTSNMVYVSCERCRFSGGGNSFATSGYVPVGTTITVVCGSEGNLATGYSINGAAGSNKGQASFKLTIDADTTISMQKR